MAVFVGYVYVGKERIRISICQTSFFSSVGMFRVSCLSYRDVSRVLSFVKQTARGLDTNCRPRWSRKNGKRVGARVGEVFVACATQGQIIKLKQASITQQSNSFIKQISI